MSDKLDFSEVKLDVKKIVNDLCGAKNPEALTQKAKVEMLLKKINAISSDKIKVRAIEKWIDKNMISGPRITELGIVAAKMGIRFDLYPYMIDENGNNIYKV